MTRPSCEGCGVCCLDIQVPPFGVTEIAALDPVEREALRAYVQSPRAVGPCCWLDLVTGKCREYDRRPQFCRDHPTDAICLSIRREHRLGPPQDAR